MSANPTYDASLVAHEVGHILGGSHDNSTPATIMHMNNNASMTFSTASQNEIWGVLNNFGDNSCVVTGEINMFLNSLKIDAYDYNNSCVYDYEYLYAPGINTITWNVTTAGATPSTIYSDGHNITVNSGGSTGSYEVQASKSNACGNIDRYFPFYVDNCFSLKVYPNGTSDFLYLEIDKKATLDQYPDEITIVDEKGNVLIKKLPQEMLNNNEIDVSNPKITIDLSELPEGIYYLRLFFKKRKENQYETKRIIKLPK